MIGETKPDQERPDPAQAPPQVQSKVAQPVQCPKCKAMMMVSMPTVRVMNSPEVSMVVLVHEVPQGCQNCGAAYIPLVTGFNPAAVQLTFQEVAAPQQVVAPTAEQVAAVDRSKGIKLADS